jgi:hypothetical protein
MNDWHELYKAERAVRDGFLGFHSKEGWYFRRLPDGSVLIQVRPSGPDKDPSVFVRLDADTWA